MSFPLLRNPEIEMEVYVSSLLSAPAPPTQIHKCRVWAATVKEGEAPVRRRRALRRVDRELEKGNYKAAISLVKQLKAHPAGLLLGFGAAAPKVPRRVPFLDDLRFAGDKEVSSLHSVVDAILHSIKCSLQLQEDEAEISQQDFDKKMDAESENYIYKDRLMCTQHEAGHFLVGYMLGIFPRRYKIPSVEDIRKDTFARGKVEFVGFEFLRRVGSDIMSNNNFSRGKLNNETLLKFSCVTLGGLAAEHLLYGYSQLLHSDVSKLDRVLKWSGFTEHEVDSETRQAVEAVVLILSHQSEAQCELAKAMAKGKSVGFCVDTIETTLNFNKL